MGEHGGLLESVAIEHEVVIETGGEPNLLFVGTESLADQLAETEIEGCPGHRAELPDGDERGIDRGKGAGIDLQAMGFDRAVAFARQIEIRMVGEIDDRGFVGGGAVVDRAGRSRSLSS